MQANGSVTEFRVRVRYAETDMMGHTYYANYLVWLEAARGAWCRDRGFTYLGLEEIGVKLPVVEVHLNYRGESTYDDLIRIDVRVTEVKRSSIRFDYEIWNETKEHLCATGHTWHVNIGDRRKATRLPEDVREMMARDPIDHATLPA